MAAIDPARDEELGFSQNSPHLEFFLLTDASVRTTTKSGIEKLSPFDGILLAAAPLEVPS